MTGIQAINKAMRVFAKRKLGDIRGVSLLEGNGSGDKWQSLNVRIEYSKNGDYTASDKNPFIATVVDSDGKITVTQTTYYL